MSVVIYFLTGMIPAHAGENIEITLRNFYDINAFHKNFEYSKVKEVGIPVNEHILIIKSCHCLDNATDKNGNEYYFYMVDRPKGLKALISAAQLIPVEKLDDKTWEFYELVKKEIKKDGGIKAIIDKFKKSSRKKGRNKSEF